jgi:hypothetical protein
MPSRRSHLPQRAGWDGPRMQIKLFETALDELDQNSDLINQVLEITSMMRTMQNSRSYDTNCLRCPFHSQREQPERRPDRRSGRRGPARRPSAAVLCKSSTSCALARRARKLRSRWDLNHWRSALKAASRSAIARGLVQLFVCGLGEPLRLRAGLCDRGVFVRFGHWRVSLRTRPAC